MAMAQESSPCDVIKHLHLTYAFMEVGQFSLMMLNVV